MRVRNNAIAFAIVAAAVLSPASIAHAQGPVPPPARTAAPAAPTPPPVRTPKAPIVVVPAILPGVEHVFTPPSVIGEAWARALRAVLDQMKQVVDTQKAALRPQVAPPSAAPTAPSVPAWRAVWLPASALREAIAQSPVQVGPVTGVPPLEAGRDAHGENVVLLGARVELPWIVP